MFQLYFRSLPEPLLTFDLYQDFIQAAKFSLRYQVSCLRKLVSRLPRPHQTTLAHLMKHLQELSRSHEATGMTSRNLAIVWAPNLLRPNNQDCLRDCGLQALVVEALIVYYEEIFEAEKETQEQCVTRRNFTKEVSIDQAVARAESFKPPHQAAAAVSRPSPVAGAGAGPGPGAGAGERRMVRSISCVSTMKVEGREGRGQPGPGRFQGRGVHLKRDRSLNCDNVTRHRQVGEEYFCQF